jgi:aryl-alcohol dehydrogenase-like predicted oxidoreductase
MEYVLLGRTGVRVSRICIGTGTFGVAPLEQDAGALVHRALNLGINFFDTANSYGNQPRFDRPGVPLADQRSSSEEILGRALKGRRNEVIIASKVMEKVGTGVNDGGPGGGGLTRVHIMQQIERTLRRLQTDHIDIYYAHHPDLTTPIDQTLRTMNDLVTQGKIRHFALSTYPAWRLTEAVLTAEKLGVHPPVAHQVGYNMTMRAVEPEVVPACLRFGVSLTTFSSLGGGLLSGVANTRRSISGTQRWRSGGGNSYTPEQVAVAEEMENLSAEWGHPPAHLALAWLLSRPAVASAIVGPEDVAQLEQNAGATDIKLSDEQLEILNGVGTNIPPPRPLLR